MLDKEAPTGDADVFKCLGWQEALEALRWSSPRQGFCGGGKNVCCERQRQITNQRQIVQDNDVAGNDMPVSTMLDTLSESLDISDSFQCPFSTPLTWLIPCILTSASSPSRAFLPFLGLPHEHNGFSMALQGPPAP